MPTDNPEVSPEGFDRKLGKLEANTFSLLNLARPAVIDNDFINYDDLAERIMTGHIVVYTPSAHTRLARATDPHNN